MWKRLISLKIKFNWNSSQYNFQINFLLLERNKKNPNQVLLYQTNECFMLMNTVYCGYYTEDGVIILGILLVGFF